MTAFSAELLDAAGRVIASTETRAWNSAIRASEGLLREHARKVGATFEGRPPFVEHVDGSPHDKALCGHDCTRREYTRAWSSGHDGWGLLRLVTTRVGLA